jgi:hypothetical protein
MRLAQLCHAFVKMPHETVAKALVDDYRPEHLFTLKQFLDSDRHSKRTTCQEWMLDHLADVLG